MVKLECNHTEVSERLIKNITWFLNEVQIDETENLKTLIVNKAQNDSYFCEIEFKNGQNIRSESVKIPVKGKFTNI